MFPVYRLNLIVAALFFFIHYSQNFYNFNIITDISLNWSLIDSGDFSPNRLYSLIVQLMKKKKEDFQVGEGPARIFSVMALPS